ncbi:hypothetical protein ACIQPQ_02530 [Streptomyces sp. NPDC091281]|uniref:hypothetical protein n=1 Tax=Streptomyces sp. NPDC091281 TaxID=3365985 RepID=UPI0037F98F60
MTTRALAGPGGTDAPWLTRREQEWLGTHLRTWLGSRATVPLTPAPRPFHPPAARVRTSRDRPRAVDAFFHHCLGVYRAVLDGTVPPVVARALYGDLPPHLGLDFHRSLGAAATAVPRSYRTDESLDGRMYEIQAPGSGWGEYLLLADHAAAFHPGTAPDAATVAQRYVDALRRAVGTDDPAVLYLTDTATGQTGVRYFVERTRAAGARYYGLDTGVGPDDVRHIRSHSFPSLFTEQHPSGHLARAAREPHLYDPSVNALFFSKITTALPFWRFTRDLFSDADRSLFPHTAVLEAEGVQMPDGQVLPYRAFAAGLQKTPYFLKYAGHDVYRGSGGAGIHLLDGRSPHGEEALARAREQSAAGRTWIVQEALDAHDAAWDAQYRGVTGRIPKLSVLCALGTYLGSMVLAGTADIVHAGTSDALALCAEPPAEPPRPLPARSSGPCRMPAARTHCDEEEREWA